jgi:hypothetical protein
MVYNLSGKFVKLYWVQINSTNIHLNMQLKSAVLKRPRHKLDVNSIANIDLLIKVTVYCTGCPKKPNTTETAHC